MSHGFHDATCYCSGTAHYPTRAVFPAGLKLQIFLFFLPERRSKGRKGTRLPPKQASPPPLLLQQQYNSPPSLQSTLLLHPNPPFPYVLRPSTAGAADAALKPEQFLTAKALPLSPSSAACRDLLTTIPLFRFPPSFPTVTCGANADGGRPPQEDSCYFFVHLFSSPHPCKSVRQTRTFKRTSCLNEFSGSTDAFWRISSQLPDAFLEKLFVHSAISPPPKKDRVLAAPLSFSLPPFRSMAPCSQPPMVWRASSVPGPDQGRKRKKEKGRRVGGKGEGERFHIQLHACFGGGWGRKGGGGGKSGSGEGGRKKREGGRSP